MRREEFSSGGTTRQVLTPQEREDRAASFLRALHEPARFKVAVAAWREAHPDPEILVLVPPDTYALRCSPITVGIDFSGYTAADFARVSFRDAHGRATEFRGAIVPDAALARLLQEKGAALPSVEAKGRTP